VDGDDQTCQRQLAKKPGQLERLKKGDHKRGEVEGVPRPPLLLIVYRGKGEGRSDGPGQETWREVEKAADSAGGKNQKRKDKKRQGGCRRAARCVPQNSMLGYKDWMKRKE